MRDIPIKRDWHGSVTISRKAFIISGIKGNNGIIDINIYDKLTNSFQSVNATTTNPSGFGICTIKGDILISGGHKLSDNLKVCFLYTTSCILYNPPSNTFKPIANMNIERSGHTLVNMNDKFVFSIGGLNGRDDKPSYPESYLNCIEKYDPETDKWTIVDQKLNIARSYHQAVAYKHYIFVVAGASNMYNVLDSIEKINLINGTTTLIDTKLKIGRKLFALAKINNYAYILGGITSDSMATDTVEIFNMEDETITDGKNIPIFDYGLTACVL